MHLYTEHDRHETGRKMESVPTPESVAEYAKGIDLYGWRDRIMSRLAARNYRAAQLFCGQAKWECLKQSGFDPLVRDPAVHFDNYEKLKQLETMIDHLRHAVEAHGSQTTVF